MSFGTDTSKRGAHRLSPPANSLWKSLGTLELAQGSCRKQRSRIRTMTVPQSGDCPDAWTENQGFVGSTVSDGITGQLQ